MLNKHKDNTKTSVGNTIYNIDIVVGALVLYSKLRPKGYNMTAVINTIAVISNYDNISFHQQTYNSPDTHTDPGDIPPARSSSVDTAALLLRAGVTAGWVTQPS